VKSLDIPGKCLLVMRISSLVLLASMDECPKSHMRRFWKFFQHFPIDDEAEDLVMKLFSASLHGEARRWYDNLPAASINSMELFEEIFLAKWTMKIEVVQSLLKELEGIRQAESEIVRAFGVGFRDCFTRFHKAIVLKETTLFTSILMDFRHI
jgi:hypothetical protein